jgi:hypothetical protein
VDREALEQAREDAGACSEETQYGMPLLLVLVLGEGQTDCIAW